MVRWQLTDPPTFGGKVIRVSASTVTLSLVSKLAVTLAALSVLALIGTLVLYFQGVAIPGMLMGFGMWGLPAAFILGIMVVIGNIVKRRNN